MPTAGEARAAQSLKKAPLAMHSGAIVRSTGFEPATSLHIFAYPDIMRLCVYAHLHPPRMASALLSKSDVSGLDELFKGFADPTRIRILNVLAAGELCVCDIHEILELPQPLVSRHLARLRNAGLVEVERNSQFAHYRLAAPENGVHRNLINCVRTSFKGIDGLDDERDAAERRVKERETKPC